MSYVKRQWLRIAHQYCVRRWCEMTRSVCNTKLGLVWSPSSYIALVFATLVLCVIETVSSSSIDEENRDISPPATTAAGDIALLRTPTPLGIRNKYDGSTLQSNLHHIGPHDPTLLRDLFLPRTRKRLRAGGLRTTELRITPRVVQRGKNVTMSCQFPPHEYGVYSVKWYKGTQEFYRYSPLDTPQIRLLPVNGIKVDRLRSNETHVFLIRVGANISGNYTCEAIHNSHAYPQYMASARLDVVAVGGLRATDLRISPPVVQRGNDTTLACLYELTDAPLYSVKWYRGRHEFYRYSPTENPTTKIFPFAGINVDLARSNQSQVVLTRVSFGLSGNFSCEVTADAPSFATSIVSNTMEVVALPPSLPVIQTDKHYYGPGDVLHANCTSGPSRPPADLIFLLNDQPHDIDAHQVHPAPEGLFRSEIYSSIQLWPAHYERGAPILRCQAKIGDLYKDDAAVALYSGNSHPKIERVTSPGSAGSLQVCQFLLLLHIIVWANNT